MICGQKNPNTPSRKTHRKSEVSKCWQTCLPALKLSNWPGVRLATLTAPGGVGPGSNTNTTFSEASFDANLTNSFWRLWGVLLASRWRLISRHQHLWNMDWEGIRFLICFGETYVNLHMTWQQYYLQLALPATPFFLSALWTDHWQRHVMASTTIIHPDVQPEAGWNTENAEVVANMLSPCWAGLRPKSANQWY